MRIEVCLSPFDATWEDLSRAARAADELGIPGIWMMDHLTGTVHQRNHVLECFSVLGGIAQHTERARLGSLVVNSGLRTPALLAQAAATVQDQSGGRFVLGLGAGGGAGTPYAAEMEVIGVGDAPGAVRRARVEETVTIIKRLWDGATEAWQGEHFRIGPATGFLQPLPAPPLLIGGFGPKMAAMAGRLAAAFNTHATHAELEALLTVARQAAEAERRAAPEMTVFHDFDEGWLDADSVGRRRLDDAGVDTLILVVGAPFDGGVLNALAATTG